MMGKKPHNYAIYLPISESLRSIHHFTIRPEDRECLYTEIPIDIKLNGHSGLESINDIQSITFESSRSFSDEFVAKFLTQNKSLDKRTNLIKENENLRVIRDYEMNQRNDYTSGQRIIKIDKKITENNIEIESIENGSCEITCHVTKYQSCVTVPKSTIGSLTIPEPIIFLGMIYGSRPTIRFHWYIVNDSKYIRNMPPDGLFKDCENKGTTEYHSINKSRTIPTKKRKT